MSDTNFASFVDSLIGGTTDTFLVCAGTTSPVAKKTAAEVRSLLGVYTTSQVDSAVASKIGGSVGATDNRLVRSDGTGTLTVQSTGITVDDSNNVSGVGTLACGAITASGDITVRSATGSAETPVKFGASGLSMGNTWGGRLNFNHANGSAFLFAASSSYLWAQGAIAIGGNMGGSPDVLLHRDSAGVLAQRNSTVAQTFRLYNTYTDASNYERLEVGQQTAADAVIRTAAGGTGTRRNLTIDAPITTVTGAITASGLMCSGVYTVATLPSASANASKFAVVTDSSVTTNGSTVAGSGSSRVMVFSNGTDWKVIVA